MDWLSFLVGIWAGWLSLVGFLVFWDRRIRRVNWKAALDIVHAIRGGRLCALCGAAINQEDGRCSACGCSITHAGREGRRE